MMKILRLKISLTGIKPAIWRRLEIPAAQSLNDLHKVIQAAFGWTDTHMHQFEMEGLYFSPPDPYDENEALNSRKQPLAELEGRITAFHYNYDFGDDWRHKIDIEAWSESEPGVKYPRCTAGRRACPPEDCGGLPGYQELVQALGDAKHERHKELSAWLAEIYVGNHLGWQPDYFSLEDINQALAGLKLSKPPKGPGPLTKAPKRKPRGLLDEAAVQKEVLDALLKALKTVGMTEATERQLQALMEGQMRGKKEEQ